jgi:hypothetical protein
MKKRKRREELRKRNAGIGLILIAWAERITEEMAGVDGQRTGQDSGAATRRLSATACERLRHLRRAHRPALRVARCVRVHARSVGQALCRV